MNYVLKSNISWSFVKDYSYNDYGIASTELTGDITKALKMSKEDAEQLRIDSYNPLALTVTEYTILRDKFKSFAADDAWFSTSNFHYDMAKYGSVVVGATKVIERTIEAGLTNDRGAIY